jgi:hypothetical protein
VLVLHGTEDRILPFEVTAARLPALLADCTLIPVEGGPHNIAWTHPEEVNTALLIFLGETEVPVPSNSMNDPLIWSCADPPAAARKATSSTFESLIPSS